MKRMLVLVLLSAVVLNCTACRQAKTDIDLPQDGTESGVEEPVDESFGGYDDDEAFSYDGEGVYEDEEDNVYTELEASESAFPALSGFTEYREDVFNVEGINDQFVVLVPDMFRQKQAEDGITYVEDGVSIELRLKEGTPEAEPDYERFNGVFDKSVLGDSYYYDTDWKDFYGYDSWMSICRGSNNSGDTVCIMYVVLDDSRYLWFRVSGDSSLPLPGDMTLEDAVDLEYEVYNMLTVN